MFEGDQLQTDDEQDANVNLSPLIDMVFILLIFFIVTTNFNRQTGVDVAKPKAQSATYQGQKTILIGITREGSIHLFGRQVGKDFGLPRLVESSPRDRSGDLQGISGQVV